MKVWDRTHPIISLLTKFLQINSVILGLWMLVLWLWPSCMTLHILECQSLLWKVMSIQTGHMVAGRPSRIWSSPQPLFSFWYFFGHIFLFFWFFISIFPTTLKYQTGSPLGYLFTFLGNPRFHIINRAHFLCHLDYKGIYMSPIPHFYYHLTICGKWS